MRALCQESGGVVPELQTFQFAVFRVKDNELHPVVKSGGTVRICTLTERGGICFSFRKTVKSIICMGEIDLQSVKYLASPNVIVGYVVRLHIRIIQENYILIYSMKAFLKEREKLFFRKKVSRRK